MKASEFLNIAKEMSKNKKITYSEILKKVFDKSDCGSCVCFVPDNPIDKMIECSNCKQLYDHIHKKELEEYRSKFGPNIILGE